ncbi:MAG TPA: hypothetical protein VIB39_01230 [Candidatus Angelobacter sp.]
MQKPVWSIRAALAVLTLGITIAGVSAKAQESLGDRARKIRAQKENAAATKASPDSKKALSPAAADLTATMGLISETDPAKYADGVRLLFEQERFRVMDDVAAGERTNKTRFAGGEWKLREFYESLAAPGGKGRGVVADWNAYRERLNKWVGIEPQSITARVAMAQGELLYAWQLRGPGAPGTIAPDRYDLFMTQLKQTEAVLNQASDLQEKCPEWYNVMLQVGRAKGWDQADLSTLLERAAAFEPQYFYVYQQQALTLTPLWRGKDGDAEKFADDQANRAGGKPGDILYFQIAQSIIGNPDLAKMPQHFVWSRALVGYQGLIEQYGSSVARQNQIAFMAARFGDYMAADDLFTQIGDHWDKGTWGSQEYFDKVKAWARGAAGPFKKIIDAYKAVNANVATPEGQRYDGQIAKEFTARYARAVHECTTPAGSPPATLLIMQVGKTGTVQEMLVVPQEASDACLRPKLEKANFSPPPKPEYWVRVSLK